MDLRDPYAETVLANFAGKTTTWREIKLRCGFSDHEVDGALNTLRRHKLVRGTGHGGEPVEVLKPNLVLSGKPAG